MLMQASHRKIQQIVQTPTFEDCRYKRLQRRSEQVELGFAVCVRKLSTRKERPGVRSTFCDSRVCSHTSPHASELGKKALTVIDLARFKLCTMQSAYSSEDPFPSLVVKNMQVLLLFALFPCSARRQVVEAAAAVVLQIVEG